MSRRDTSSGKAAATVPIYQYSNANALAIVKQVKQEMDRLATNFPPDLEYRIAFDTTRYVEENINEVEHTLRRGVRTGADRGLCLPPGPAHDADPHGRHPGRRSWPLSA